MRARTFAPSQPSRPPRHSAPPPVDDGGDKVADGIHTVVMLLDGPILPAVGGSGTPEEKIIECIENGINKINVNTEISQYTVKKLAEIIKEDPNTHLSKLTLMQEDIVSEIVEKYIRLFARV